MRCFTWNSVKNSKWSSGRALVWDATVVDTVAVSYVHAYQVKSNKTIHISS